MQEGDFCIDATAGTGQDTGYLAQLCGERGKVLAFDIQEQVLQMTEERLGLLNLKSRVQLILDSHEHMEQYALAESVSCVTFNFGYLPKGDHSICTR
ncbi:MAG: class I SAM-dependent methyltransferase, partial [Lachnospiraceae bacterium]